MSSDSPARRLEVTQPGPRSWILAGAALAVACAAVIGLGGALLRPPADELLLLAIYLLLSGSVSLVIGYGGLALLGRVGIGGLRVRVAFGQLLVIAVAFINIVVTALLMFLSPHDLALLGLLMFFAAVLALFFALAVAGSIAGAIGVVTDAARRMAAGDLSVRADVGLRDEVGEMARAFNQMAARLEEAARQQHDAEQSRRDLVAAVSHDLRTPLASIRAMVEAINDGVVSDRETIERYLETVQGETERLARLIDDLFELSQIDAGQLRLRLEKGSLHDLISDTLRSMRAQAERRGVHLVGAADPALPSARLDPARIQRVLDNLVGNALRHTPDGGTVELRAHETSDGLEVEVRDDGEGIAAEELPRIFESFYRGERSRGRDGGAGLGLTIARGIVAAHGGRIDVESRPGAGTTFRFTLPCARSI